MKGQVFILGALTLVIAMFVFLPVLQEELYLPEADSPALDNIATQYNYWISYSSIDENYNPLAFGKIVKQNYPFVEFFYVLADGEKVYVANFLDSSLNVSINGKEILTQPSSFDYTTFHGNLTFSSDYWNFSYEPKNKFSGAIFLRLNSPSVRLSEKRIFR